jgi:5-methylcytosine-specific restriction endonuclease McrA
MAKYTIDSKQIIEKEIAHLKNAMLFTTSKPEYEKLIKNKEDELKECEEWIYSKEGITLKIKDIENTIKYRKLVLDQKHPMTTSEDIKAMIDLLSKYEEELKIYQDKLLELNQKPTKPKKQPKEKSKPKKKTISSTMKKLVWNTNIGEDIGKTKCLCCKSTDITQMAFNCGHVISEHNGGETIVSNLKPICQNCNSSMGTKNMNEFMLSLM